MKLILAGVIFATLLAASVGSAFAIAHHHPVPGGGWLCVHHGICR